MATRDDGGLAGMPLWRYAAITAIVLVVVTLGDLLLRATTILALIFISFLIAVGLEPAVSWLVRRSIRRTWAVVIVTMAGLTGFAGLATVILVPAIGQFGEFVSTAPDTISRLATELGADDNPIGRFLNREEMQSAFQDGLSNLPSVLGSSIGTVFGVLARIAGGLFAVLTVAVLTVYFMVALPRIVDRVAVLLGTPERDRVWRAALDKVGAYLLGQIIISTIAGLSALLFLLVAGVPYAAVLAVAVGLLSFLPQVGATIGAGLSIAVALSVSVPTALFTVAFFIVYQLVENYLIAPRIFSKTTAMSPLLVFCAALVGAGAAGFIGAIVALPITAGARVVIGAVLDKRMSRGRQAIGREADVTRGDGPSGRCAPPESSPEPEG